MINEQELFLQIQKAEQAGDTAHAKKVADFIKQQRSAFSQANGFTNNSIVDKYGIDGTMQKLQETAPDKVADTMGRFEKIMVGVGKGFTDIGQGAAQIAQRGANLYSQGMGRGETTNTENLDNQIRQENTQFNQDFEGDLYAKGGRLGGQIIGTAPLGGAVGSLAKPITSASRGVNALRYAKQGAAVGASEAALMPTFGDNFAQEKLSNIGVGTAFGGLFGSGIGAIKGGKELLKDGVGATIENSLNKGGKTGLGKVLTGNADDIAERQALYARNPDVLASKAQKSGSKYDKIIEEFGKSNVFLADQADDMASKELASLSKWVSGQADNIAKTANPTEQTFRNIQLLPKKITDKLVKARSETGRKLYGEVHNFAKGQRVINLDNVEKAMFNIIEDSRGVVGSDVQKIAAQSKQMINNFKNGFTAKQGHNQLKAWSTHGGGRLFKDIESFGADDYAKKQLSNALLKDMDNVDGELGDMLRIANQAWKKGSQEIEQVESSIFGKFSCINFSINSRLLRN